MIQFPETIRTPQLLEEVVEYFLDRGAALNMNPTSNHSRPCKPTVLSLFAKKSVIFLEGLETPLKKDPTPCKKYSAITIMLFQGLISGTVPLSAVQELHDMLHTELGDHLPPDFRPLESLYSMTMDPPSLFQLVRTKIRRRVSECGRFRRENLRKLPLPAPLRDLIQLGDLGDGSEVEKIMEGAEEVLRISSCHADCANCDTFWVP